jgi:transposase InsO family protein
MPNMSDKSCYFARMLPVTIAYVTFLNMVKEGVMVQYLVNTCAKTEHMYTSNERMPRIRRDAVRFAKRHGLRAAARHFGFSPGAIHLWMQRAKQYGDTVIPTRSSKPKSHPQKLSDEMVEQIVATRLRVRRSAGVVHETLQRTGIVVSLTSVKRTLDRQGLLQKRSPWKRFHAPVPRPNVEKPGDLVQVDTIHLLKQDGTRLYVFTCLDVYSRWAYARAYEKANTRAALAFLRRAQTEALFSFSLIQSDHGPEFSTSFSEHSGLTHRHSRVRRPNDNAHLERFNRTIQEECLDTLEKDVRMINKKLPEYLKYYNTERMHFGLKLKTPQEVFTRY